MRSAIIPDYCDYTIYENGDVYSKVRRGGGGKLTHTISNGGYYTVSLTKDSFSKNFTLHRLLGICFLDNPDNLPCIDHIDRNRLNNNLDNLRWVTYKENNENKEKTKGSIYINKRYFNDTCYEYIRYSWYENGKRKSKNFKSIEDAEKFKEKTFS